jgi:hypothetical protein
MRYKPHAVYLMHNEWSAANYKIGMSKNPDRRRNEVEEGYANVLPKIITVCWFATEAQARKAENIWHRRFSKKLTDDQGGKEWFSLTDADIAEFQQWSSNSKSRVQLIDWLFKDGASSKDVYHYVGNLFNAIPRKHARRTVEVWRNEDYLEPRFRIYQIVTKRNSAPLRLIRKSTIAFSENNSPVKQYC